MNFEISALGFAGQHRRGGQRPDIKSILIQGEKMAAKIRARALEEYRSRLGRQIQAIASWCRACRRRRCGRGGPSGAGLGSLQRRRVVTVRELSTRPHPSRGPSPTQNSAGRERR
jgi:hypothetical protein